MDWSPGRSKNWPRAATFSAAPSRPTSRRLPRTACRSTRRSPATSPSSPTAATCSPVRWTTICASSPKRAASSTMSCRSMPARWPIAAHEISELLSDDIGKIEDAFRRQTGVIEERTGTMERALSAGVDNVRQVLEKSAVVVAGALREKVLEVTSALAQEAGNAFSDADRKLAQRAETTSSALMARATEISNAFDQAERELASRADANARALIAHTNETTEQLQRSRVDATACAALDACPRDCRRVRSGRPAPRRTHQRDRRPARRSRRRNASLLSARAREIAGTFDEADQRLVARAAETASVLANRAGDILRNFDDADQRLNSRIGEFGGSAGSARGRAFAHLRRRRRTPRDAYLGERRHARRARQRDRPQLRAGRRPPDGAGRRNRRRHRRPRNRPCQRVRLGRSPDRDARRGKRQCVRASRAPRRSTRPCASSVEDRRASARSPATSRLFNDRAEDRLAHRRHCRRLQPGRAADHRPHAYKLGRARRARPGDRASPCIGRPAHGRRRRIALPSASPSRSAKSSGGWPTAPNR